MSSPPPHPPEKSQKNWTFQDSVKYLFAPFPLIESNPSPIVLTRTQLREFQLDHDVSGFIEDSFISPGPGPEGEQGSVDTDREEFAFSERLISDYRGLTQSIDSISPPYVDQKFVTQLLEYRNRLITLNPGDDTSFKNQVKFVDYLLGNINKFLFSFISRHLVLHHQPLKQIIHATPDLAAKYSHLNAIDQTSQTPTVTNTNLTEFPFKTGNKTLLEHFSHLVHLAESYPENTLLQTKVKKLAKLIEVNRSRLADIAYQKWIDLLNHSASQISELPDLPNWDVQPSSIIPAQQIHTIPHESSKFSERNLKNTLFSTSKDSKASTTTRLASAPPSTLARISYPPSHLSHIIPDTEEKSAFTVAAIERLKEMSIDSQK